MLTLTHGDHSIDISTDSLIILQNSTEEDYWNLANEDLKVEFDGRCLFIHSPARYEHEKLLMEILFIINNYLKKNPMKGDVIGSRFALKLPNGKRPEPDIIILSPNSVDPKSSVYEGVPLAVIEILLPSNYDHDFTTKKQWYFDAEIPKIMYIDLDNGICYIYNKESNYNEEKINNFHAEKVLNLLF
ncbi:MAG: Uma2 family endonuclease [Candidatus Heimdallarchaeota archaeon]|nr:Uma2 family endonuclease [Candidatus Heimdallarchaeota archaeon]